VTLLEALLTAKGIPSSTALINASTAYNLPKVPAYVHSFNHVITYIPEFNLFADSTAQSAQFGVIPAAMVGKQTLVSDSGTGKAILMNIPLANVKTNYVSSELNLTLDEKGNWQGTSSIEPIGVFDFNSRYIFGLVGQDTTQFAQRILNTTGQSGSGSYTKSDKFDLSQPFKYATKFELTNSLPIPGPSAFSIPRGLSSFEGIASMVDTAQAKTRQFPLILTGGQFNEVIKIKLPSSLKLLNSPKAITINNKFGTYASTYSQEQGVLNVSRQLSLNYANPVLESAIYSEFYEMVQAIQRDLKTQFLYQ
jgi:hypothetical protein